MKFFTVAAVLLLCACFATAQTPATPANQAASAANNSDLKHGPVLEYASDHDAVIAWTSTAGSDMQIHYGPSANSLTLAADALENSTSTNHRVKLINLQPSTTYYIQLTNNTGQPLSSVFSFQTPAKGAPAIHEQNLGK
jgi:phosphodiesterase/alkaline phosphatase D-like protein